MKKVIFLALAALFLVGCADKYFKVTRIDAEGQFNPFVTAKRGGYVVEQQGDMNGVVITWTDENGSVKVTK